MKLSLKSRTNSIEDSKRLNNQPISEQGTDLRRRTTIKTTALLMSLHTFRVAGLFIFVIYGLSVGVLPATFAYSAGVGDFLIAIAVIPLAYLLIRRVRFSRELAIVWNGFGLLDFALAYTLGTDPKASATMLSFPWVIIPAGLVPIFVTIHGIILYRLTRNNGEILRTVDRRILR
jgi:hypothetical protein